MKGIELPINILVIVAVAIIVLLGVIALFYSSWFSGTAPMTLEAAKSQACNSLSRAGCTNGVAASIPMDFDANKDGSVTAADTLLELCDNYYNAATETACKNQVCGMQC